MPANSIQTQFECHTTLKHLREEGASREREASYLRPLKPKNVGDRTEVENRFGEGKIPEDWWDDIAILTNQRERVGYPTQKPIALLERIIKASSNEGDVVLDPFCGCATTCIAAERLNRQWIGIDLSALAVQLVERRARNELGLMGGVQAIAAVGHSDAD